MVASRTANGRSFTLVVVAGSLITSIGLGARSTFGLYLDPVVESLGSDRGAFSLAIAIQNLTWGLSQPVAGAIADRYGSARVLGAGGIGYAAALVMMSSAHSTGVFYLSTGFLVGLATGGASFSVVLAAVGRMAPPGKASIALGIVTAMGSVGQFVLVPITRSLIASNGWRDTAASLAVVVAAIALLAPLIRGRAIDQQGGAEPGSSVPAPLRHELRRAAHSRSFLLLNAAFFVCGFHVTFIATHLVSYAGDRGVGDGPASTGLAVIGLFNIAGSLIAGYLGGRYLKSRLLSVIYGLRALVIAAFVLVPVSEVTVVAFGALIGLLWLSTVPLTGGIVASQFGTTHSGTLFGIVFLSHQIGAFIGVWMGGELADRAGTYAPVWWIAVGLGVLAAVLHLMIDERPALQPPVASSPLRVAPAAGVAALMIGLGSAAAMRPSPAAAEPAEPAAAPYVCVLHPGSEVLQRGQEVRG